ncbi:transaldolase [Aspergillus karnatakaensis]|uniref:transaldolase family protein n=1 Tax=Aspergillus karnatakaensis TaxID=1810916 RepID=UPI003CCCB7B5
MASSINVLEYLRQNTQVDLDALDLDAAKNGALGKPYVDATSNQIEVFFQLENPANAAIIQQTLSVTAEIHHLRQNLTFDELAVEVAGVILAARVLPYISGNVHVMANPYYAFNTQKVVDTGRRYHAIFRHLDSNIDLSRVVMKVPATWEGLQACKTLKAEGIQTLGTTVFSLEQCILAGEAGCVSVSPFIHDLKRVVDPSHKDDDPLIALCVQAQEYYKQHSIPTRVKACSPGSIDEILRLAGVDAHTIELPDLEAMASEERDQTQLESLCLFAPRKAQSSNGIEPPVSYIDNEARFRLDLAASKGGKSQFKLYRAIDVFCDFQRKDEQLFREARG